MFLRICKQWILRIGDTNAISTFLLSFVHMNNDDHRGKSAQMITLVLFLTILGKAKYIIVCMLVV